MQTNYNATAAFLSALVNDNANEDKIRFFDWNIEQWFTCDHYEPLSEALGDLTYIRASLVTEDGHCVGVSSRFLESEVTDFDQATASMILQDGLGRHAIWLLDKAVPAEEVADIQNALYCDPEVPLPGHDGCSLIHPASLDHLAVRDYVTVYTLEELRMLFADLEPIEDDVFAGNDQPPEDAEDNDHAALDALSGVNLDEAEVIGTMPDHVCALRMAIGGSSKGIKRTKPGQWKNTTGTFLQLIEELSKHQEHHEKDGPSILQGEVVDGERKALAMKTMYLMALDLDDGEDMDAVIDRVHEKNWACVIYTTHSHLKDETAIRRDDLINWIGNDGAAPTEADVVAYLIDKKGYKPHIVDGLAVTDWCDHQADGVMVIAKHQPIPKFRMVFPLMSPVELAKRGNTQKEGITEWENKVTGLAINELGIQLDVSCTDPSRLFYKPRHPHGAQYRTVIIGGEALDYDAIRIADKQQYAKSGKRQPESGEAGNRKTSAKAKTGKSRKKLHNSNVPLKTPSGKCLKKWSANFKHSFQLADVTGSRVP